MLLTSILPMVSCAVAAALAGAILMRDSTQPANRLAALLLSGAAFWALCETVWEGLDDPSGVLLLLKISAIGWVWMGPLSLELFLEIADAPLPRLRRALPALYVSSGLFLPVIWFTPWIHTRVELVDWGWAYHLGPAYGVFYAFTAGCLALALYAGWRGYHLSVASEKRDQARWMSMAVLVPLIAASATDGLLPLAGHPVPRLGVASFAVMGALILWTFHRYGYSLGMPAAFTWEILETLPDGLAVLSLDGRVRTANRTLARLLDMHPGELPGLCLTDRLSEPIHPTDEPTERQCELTTSAGSTRPVAISSTLLGDREGRGIGLVLVVRDLQEVEALRQRLMLSGRLAAVGELAAGIAHEINNPLAFVRANLSLLRQHWQELGAKLHGYSGSGTSSEMLGEGEELIDESLEGVDRASAIVRDVRGLAHGGQRRREPADLVELIEGVLRMAAPQLRGRVEVERNFVGRAQVSCSPQELQQVFLNLVLNAGQAIEERGTIRVSLRESGGFAIVEIEDDGCGIDPEHLDRIFDPFFTTKAVGEGTGLGLGIAYGIVRSHGGDVLVESEPGRGTRVRVHLPIHTDTLEAS